MKGTTIVSRRLEPDGCVTAGSQLQAEVKGFVAKGIPLNDEVTTRATDVGSWTSRVQEYLKSHNQMWGVDRGTDRATGAFDDALECKASAFSDTEVLPLSAKEQQRVGLAVEVRSHLFSEGTGFVKMPYYKQWVRLLQLKNGIAEKQADIETLGLAQEAARLVQWIELYGNTLGITKATDVTVDQLAVAVDGWHKAWQDLAVAVLYHYKNDDKIRNTLLTPYERVAEMERAEVRKRRAKRKAEKEAEET